MKLIDMTCPHCSAQLKVDADKAQAICEHCGATVLIDEEVQHVQYDNAEEAGYNFEKGRQRAQKEAQQQSQQSVVYVQETPKKKRKTWLWVLGWICIFPLPLTILLLRKKDMKPALKYGLIAVAWIIYLIIGLSGRPDNGGDSSTANDEPTIAVEENASADTTEEKQGSGAQSEIDQFIADINASEVVELKYSEDFTPSDKESSHYRTEFRLNAYRDALGKSYKYGDAIVDIILSSDGTIERIYMDEASIEQCENMVRYASSLLDQTVTDSDVQETIEYIDQHKTANGYYFAELGLLLLGNDSEGYEFMLKRGL